MADEITVAHARALTLRQRTIDVIAGQLPKLPTYAPDGDPHPGEPDLTLATAVWNALRAAGLLDAYAAGYSPLLAALDRCLHGRHEKDRCLDCERKGSRYSRGNTFLTPGQRIGTTLYGEPIIVPEEQSHRSDPDRWVPGPGGKML